MVDQKGKMCCLIILFFQQYYSNSESFLVQGRRQVFLQRQRTDFDGHQFAANVKGTKVGQVFVFLRHAKARRRRSTAGRRRVQFLLLG